MNGDAEVPFSESTSLEFFRGKAAQATEEQIADIVENSLISPFASSDFESPLLEENLAGRTRQILSEEMSFLQEGGIVLARTPTFVEAIRDTGTPTIDVGSSSLDSDTEATLSDVGYQNPAPVCAFAVSGADAVVDALASGILSSDPAMLVYRIGR
ncbi:hypothetical protein GCM10028857_18610 [Salinarchaeum chitinilyticum]